MRKFWNVCAVMVFVLFCFSSCIAYAQPGRHQDQKQRERWHDLKGEIQDAQSKINAGVRDGSLTPPEASRLRNELNRIRAHMDRAGQDGFNHQEMSRLEHEFAQLRRDIYRERHDTQQRGHQQRDRWHRLKSEINDAHAKIHAGVREGSLTRPEADRLRNELRRVESDMQRAGQDGISHDEMTRLEREFSQLRSDIYRERHDSQRRPHRRY